MDGRKQAVTSSFTAELFGTKESPPSSSTGIFSSIFPPPSAVSGKKSSNSDVGGSWGKQSSGNWSKQEVPAMNGEAAGYNILDKERGSAFEEERVQPCPLSSSLYYGGRDNYSRAPSNQTAGSHVSYKKDGTEDDPSGTNSHGASRGNWWQGSLYY
ncbi:hypothetical protein K2173_015636 [Erythroxylum novogranatense]|uniref:Uncharacterized protein n=1 Tax=Erythroxylum novogranatense TaxID=1862640 RepID=A0AAV8SE26_9ROSI|nr:hypothetical protein K2173_015636 [Erythroxylum novogranatense]